MNSRFRTFAEELVTILDDKDTYLDAVEALEHELDIYYDEVVKEHDISIKEQLESKIKV